MDRTADAYVAGGRTGTFTPLYCFLARKTPGGGAGLRSGQRPL